MKHSQSFLMESVSPGLWSHTVSTNSTVKCSVFFCILQHHGFCESLSVTCTSLKLLLRNTINQLAPALHFQIFTAQKTSKRVYNFMIYIWLILCIYIYDCGVIFFANDIRQMSKQVSLIDCEFWFSARPRDIFLTERAPKSDWSEAGRRLLTSSQSVSRSEPVPVSPPGPLPLTRNRGWYSRGQIQAACARWSSQPESLRASSRPPLTPASPHRNSYCRKERGWIHWLQQLTRARARQGFWWVTWWSRFHTHTEPCLAFSRGLLAFHCRAVSFLIHHVADFKR